MANPVGVTNLETQIIDNQWFAFFFAKLHNHCTTELVVMSKIWHNVKQPGFYVVPHFAPKVPIFRKRKTPQIIDLQRFC